MPDDSSLLRHAVDAVTEAAIFCRAMQSRLTSAERTRKSDGSVVTIADYAAQALVTRRLLDRGVMIPAVVGEESADTLAADADLLRGVLAALDSTGAWPGAPETDVLDMIRYRAWTPGTPPPRDYYTIDPIDGTKGFVANRQYSVCLARVTDARVTLAAVACPNVGPDTDFPLTQRHPIGVTFACTEHSSIVVAPCDRPGVPLTPMPIRPPEPIDHPRLTFSVDPGEQRLEDFERLTRLLGDTRSPAPIDSQCKYCLIARGDADAYYRPPRVTKEKVWDHAAGCLLLERAGCTVTDVRGTAIDWSHPTLSNNLGLVGAPPRLHRRILDAIATRPISAINDPRA